MRRVVLLLWATLAPLLGGVFIAPGAVTAATTTGAAWAWGNNRSSQLGYELWGSLAQRPNPAQVLGAGASDVVAVTAGKAHSLVLKSDGTVWSFGDDSRGQRGINTSAVAPNIPAQVVNLTGVKAIAAGADFSLALKTDGTVWAWGDNVYGQLGDGAVGGFSAVPVQVQGAVGITAISGGTIHALAVDGNGTAWAWGNNNDGALGNDSGVNYAQAARPYALPVNGVSGVTSIAGGYNGSMALRSDGTVWAWGWKFTGEWGDGTTSDLIVNYKIPHQVPVPAQVIAIAAGHQHRLALDAQGRVWAWGQNVEGQTGDGTVGGRDDQNHDCGCSVRPVNVSTLANVSAIAAGGGHNVALKNDGTVWAWGRDAEDQVGTNTGSCYVACATTPQQVAGLTGVIALGGGVDNAHTLVVRQFTIPSFSDIQGNPYVVAIQQLAARKVINGYLPGMCQSRGLGWPCYGPAESIKRAEMAALIARSMGWLGDQATNPFPDKCLAGVGCIDDELWHDVAVLANPQRNVVHGYPDGTYRPFGPVLREQALLYISRALVAKHVWQQQPDDPQIYPNIPATTAAQQGDRSDIATYVHYAGAAPGTDAHQAWPDAYQPSTRGWFAQTLWQALSH
ncbi:MAG: RCC1 domain-containing protein [Thermomicrobiales bacterium]